MQTVTIEELIDYKILPFDLFTEDEKLLFSAGEVMTPGKFLKLRHVENIYKKEETVTETDNTEEKNSSVEEPILDDEDFLLNRFSIFLKKEQIELQTKEKVHVAGILVESLSKIANEECVSKLRLIGDYEICHTVNTAIFSAKLAFKMCKNKDFIVHIINSVLGITEALNEEKEIIELCSYFDDLIFNKTEFEIKTAKDALKKMFEIGSRHFSAEILYRFVYMFDYNDTKQFHEMLI